MKTMNENTRKNSRTGMRAHGRGGVLLAAILLVVAAAPVFAAEYVLNFLQAWPEADLFYRYLEGLPSDQFQLLNSSTVTLFVPSDAAINAVFNSLPPIGSPEMAQYLQYCVTNGRSSPSRAAP